MRHIERRIDRIDTPDQVVVLWGSLERIDLFAADGQKYAPRRYAQRGDRPVDIFNRRPFIARDGRPSLPSQRHNRHLCLRGRINRMGGDGRGVGMCGVDQHVDLFRNEIGRQAFGAAKATDPHRNRLGGRMGGAAGQRKRYLEIGPVRETPGQLPRLAGAAQDENILHAVR